MAQDATGVHHGGGMRRTTESAEAAIRVDRVSGICTGARWLASPNYDFRPAGMNVELVVVHGISLPPGEFGGPWIEQLFTNCLPADAHPYFSGIAALKVSTHFLVKRDGSLEQYVSCNDRAWHAGNSAYRGRVNCNDFSVGIELEGADSIAYEPVQYRRLAVLICALLDAYATLAPDRITGHSDIAPGRKTDPGPAFDWPRLNALIAYLRGVAP